MVFGKRSGPCVVLLGLLLTFLLSGNPQVQAGKCIGADRARVVRLFEILSYRLQKMIGEWTTSLQAMLAELPRRAATLGVFVSKVQFRHESRETVRQLLAGETYQPDKIADGLKTLIEKASSLARPTIFAKETPPELQQEFKAETLAGLSDAFARIAGSFRVCQAVRQKNPKQCTAIEPLDPSLAIDCEELAIWVGILFQDNCSDAAIRPVADIWSKKIDRDIDVVRALCQAINKRNPDLCASMAKASRWEQAFCRAMASTGYQACKDPVFSTEVSLDCHKKVRIRDVIRGNTEAGVLSKEYSSMPLLLPALLAVRSSRSCEHLAFDKYVELVEKSALFNEFR